MYDMRAADAYNMYRSDYDQIVMDQAFF
jgi:hypothetical protein